MTEVLFHDHHTQSFTSSGRQQIQKAGILLNLFLPKRKGTLKIKNKEKMAAIVLMRIAFLCFLLEL